MRRRAGKYLAFSLYVRNERRCRILAYLYSFHDIFRNSGDGNRVLHRPVLPQQHSRFIQENGSRDEMVLDRIQWYFSRFPDPWFLCGRFRLDTRIRLADGERQPLQYAADFDNFSSNALRPIFWTAVFIGLTHFVIASGVEKGIERASKIMMPLLFLILVVMCIRSVTLPNAEAGLVYLFKPDFSKLTSSVVLSAVGQAFFSLSLGMGCLITYSSYFGKNTNMLATAWQVTIINTFVAVLAGIMIFPAVFSFGIAPSAGAQLVFITLPNVFEQLPFSSLWSLIFYILLAMAALTSTISLHEVVTAYIHEEFHMTRKKAAWLVSVGVFILGVLSSLSFGLLKELTIGGLIFFDALDYLTAKIMLPLGGMLTCIFVGIRVDKKILKAELTNEGTIKFRLFSIYVFFMKYVSPIAIGIVFLNELGLLSQLKKLF